MRRHSRYWQTIGNSEPVFINKVLLAKPHSCMQILSVAAFTVSQQSRAIAKEPIWTVKANYYLDVLWKFADS